MTTSQASAKSTDHAAEHANDDLKTTADVLGALDRALGRVTAQGDDGQVYVLKQLRHAGTWSVSRFAAGPSTAGRQRQRLERLVFADAGLACEHFLTALHGPAQP